MTDAISRRHEPTALDHDFPETPRDTPAARTSSAARDRAYEEALDRLYLPAPVTLHAVATPDGSPAVIQARLDAFKHTTEGPYRAESQTVFAPAQFRMNGGFNQVMTPAQRAPYEHAVAKQAPSDQPSEEQLVLALQNRLPKNLRVRDDVVAKANLTTALGPVRVGRGTPEQLQRITQALIDAGGLPPAAKHLPLAGRIRQMQWEHSIGLDCAGYVYGAFLATRPHATPAQYGLKTPENENFTGLAANPHFQKVDPTEARPGDIFTLGAPSHGEPGHNAIVYSHDVLADAAALRELSGTRPGDDRFKDFLLGGGRVHVLAVDSAWGAGKLGAPSGGVRRETWFYREASQTWGVFENLLTVETPPKWVGTAFIECPPGHVHRDPIGGVFRPKVDL